MVVGKPDFDLNSFGIQYKNKRVNYTNKRMGAFSQGVTTETEDASERALWSKMDKPQSAKDRANKTPANAVQSAGKSPLESPKPKRSKTRQNRYSPPNEDPSVPMQVIGTRDVEGNAVGNPGDKEETPKTSTRHDMDIEVVPGMNSLRSREVPIHSGRGSSPDVTTPEDTSSSIDKIPHATRVRAGGIVDLHGGKGTRQAQTQGEGLATNITQEGGSKHRGMKPKSPGFSPKGSAALIAAGQLKEQKKNPTLPVKEGKKLQDKKTRQAVKSNQIILKMNLMKLDLMKDAIDGRGKNTTREVDERYIDSEPQTKEGQASLERGIHEKERDYNKRLYGGDYHHGRVPREHRDKPHAKPPVTKPYKGKKTDPRIPENKLSEKERTKIETTGLRSAGLSDSHLPRGDGGEYKLVQDKELPSSGKGSPADLREKAAETIFKAIALKLDLMEVTKHKELGAKRVTPEEMPQKEASHTLQGGRDASGQHTIKPKAVGASVRRVNPKTGITENVPNEVKIEGQGNEKESTMGKIINTKDIPSPQTVANAQQLITDNPTTSDGEGTIDPVIASGTSGEVTTWNDGLPGEGSSALGGDQTETAAAEADKEDLEDKFINNEASSFMNSEVGKKIAAKRAKREAAKRKRGETVNRSISEINAMTDGMKDLMKDVKTGFTGKKQHGGEMVDYVNGVDADGWTVEDNTKGHKTIMPKGGGFKGMQIYQKHRDETKP